MRTYTSVLLASLAIALPASSATQKPKIGRAELITKDVTDTLATIARKLKTGDNIHQNEVIATAIDSEAELVLNDETKLAVGPESRIVLDSFIYDPKKKDGEVIINAAKGISKGASEHKSSGLIRT